MTQAQDERPYPRDEMIELLEMHARSADCLTSSYSETAWMCREAAEHLREASRLLSLCADREKIARLIFGEAIGLHQWDNEFYREERNGCFRTADAIIALPAESFDEWLADFFTAATRNRDASMAHPNSYGAGYDQGFYDALRECLAKRALLSAAPALPAEMFHEGVERDVPPVRSGGA